jgi:hypothetical protein
MTRTATIIRIIAMMVMVMVMVVVMMIITTIRVVITSSIAPIWSVEWVVPRIVETIEIWVVIPYRPTITTIIRTIPTIHTTIPIVA